MPNTRNARCPSSIFDRKHSPGYLTSPSVSNCNIGVKEMAEVFGTVASALSVAALFNNCVDCFEYIQMGRRFGQDYERCQLKVDIAKTRLSAWGEAVAINREARFATAAPGDLRTQRVQSILEEIGMLFQSIQKKSKTYELGAEKEDLVLCQGEDMSRVYQQLHGRLARVVRQRQKQTSLVKKAKWALYDGKHFDKLVEEITDFVDNLEKICPVEVARRRLAQLEIEEIDDEPSLEAISGAAEQVDPVLAKAAEKKLGEIAGKNWAGKTSTEGRARVQVGHQYTENALRYGTGIVDQTSNSVDAVDAKGDSAVHIGNSYGGRGIF